MSDINVGLRISYSDLDKALSSAERLDQFLRRLQTEKIQLKIDDIGISKKLLAIEREMNRLQQRRLKFDVDSRPYAEATHRIEQLRESKQKLTRERDQLRIDTKEANANLEKTRQAIQENKDAFAQLEAQAQRVEGIFSSIGNGVSTLGRTLQGLGDMFGGRVVNTMKTMTTAFATMGLYGAAQGTVQRYDTMRMFPKQMALLGFNADQSAKAVDKLEQSVIGLPTGLDEIVESARQLVTLTGDLEKGSNLAIAANNALLAGGGDAQQRTWGQRQIRDLLSAGRLRSQEWESLIKALGPGLKDIGEAMGYADYGKFRTELKANKIAAEDFLDALVKVGTGEGVLAQRADLYKDTLSATAKNIKNAIQKLGAAGLDKLGDVLKEKTGKDLPQTIVQISDAIKQKLVPALEGWVSSNGDKIVAFFDRLKNYDWIGLVKRVGKGLAQYYNIMMNLFTKVSPKIVSFLAVWAGPVGRMLQTAGSVINGLGGIVGRLIRIFGKGGGKAINAVSTGVSSLAQTAGSIKNAFAGLGLAAGFTAEVALIGGVIYEYAKVLSAISNMKFGPNLKKNLESISLVGGVSTGIAGGLTALFSALTQSGLGLAVAGGELLTGGFLAIVQQIGNIIKAYAKTINYIAGMKVPSEGKVKSIGKTIAALNTNLLEKVKKVPDKKVEWLSNLTEMTQYVADIAAALKDIRSIGEIGDMSSYINSIGKAVSSILKLDIDRSDIRKAKTEKKALSNVAEAALSIKTISQALVDMQANVTALFKRGDATAINNIASGINKILDSLSEAVKVVQGKSGEFVRVKDNTKNISEAVMSISSIAATLVGAQNNIKALITLEHGHKVTTFASDLGRIIGNLKDLFENEKLQFKSREYQVVADNLGRFKSSVSSISKIVQALVETKNTIAGIGASDRDDGLTSKITAVILRVKALMSIIEHMDISTDGTAADKVKSMSDAVKKLPGIVTSLAQVKEQVDALGVGSDGTWDLGSKLKTIMQNLNTAFGVAEGGNPFGEGGALSGAATNITGIADALKTIAQNGEAAGKGLESGQKGLSNLKKAADDGKKSIDDMASSLGKLKSAVSGIAGKAALAAAGVALLGTSAGNQTQKLVNAAAAASALASAINAIPSSKTVTIRTVGGSTQTGNAGDLKRYFRANGGPIYRAGGGSLFKPRGTDIVPAMLTPGEYVTKRNAVKYFGTSFMNRINNMDVEGALRALTIRAGSGVMGSRITNNYTRDNHANVTFNVGKATQGYSQRKAVKWARSLS